MATSPLKVGPIRHALFYLGILLRYEGDYLEAIDRLHMGARRLEDVGDMNCWAGAIRALAKCEAALGYAESAGAKVVAAISNLPVLPMQEIAKPRTLDTAAEVLLATGRHDEAAIVLGAAQSVQLPADHFRLRDPELAIVRDGVVAALGDSESTRLISEGESLGIDGVIDQTHRWLTDGQRGVSPDR